MSIPIDDTQPSKEELDFEMAFYEYIAGGENFEIIPVPLPLGFYLSEAEQQYLIDQARIGKIKLIFRIAKGDKAVVFDLHGNKLAVIPNTDDLTHGFIC